MQSIGQLSRPVALAGQERVEAEFLQYSIGFHAFYLPSALCLAHLGHYAGYKMARPRDILLLFHNSEETLN
jgi:hypothetical protein